jgi:hypothetical protein
VKALTFGGPVFLGVTKEHYQLVERERLKVGDREHFRKPFSEGLSLQPGALSEDCLDNLCNILLDVF